MWEKGESLHMVWESNSMYFKRWIITYSPFLQKSLLQNVNAFMKREREWNYIRQHPQFMQKKIKAGGPEKKEKIAATYFQAENNQSSGKAMKRKFANTLFKFKARVVPNDCCWKIQGVPEKNV